MERFSEECLEVFLREQSQLFDEPVAETPEEAEAVDSIRKATSSMKADDAVEKVLDQFARTKSNREFVDVIKKIRLF